jgi:RNA polymerase sigma factor (TIGR02999 family)
LVLRRRGCVRFWWTTREAGMRPSGGGGEYLLLSLSDVDPPAKERDIKLLALDDALQRLEAFDPQKVRLVELRYFGGLTIEETAEVLKISPATVKRDWSLARAWLRTEITEIQS